MSRLFLLGASLCVVFVFIGCGASHDLDSTTPSKVAGPDEDATDSVSSKFPYVYRNQRFDFEIRYPSDWRAVFRNQHPEPTVGDKDAQPLTHEYLMVTEVLDGSNMSTPSHNMVVKGDSLVEAPRAFEASLQIAAYNTAAAGDNQSVAEFLDEIIDLLQADREAAQLLTPPEPVSLGGREFSTCVIQFRQSGLEVKARYYVRRSGDYLLYLVASYHSDTQDELLQDIVQSMSFDGSN